MLSTRRDLTTAGQYADQLVLLHKGRIENRLLMKIYTRKGDSGQTSRWGGRRLSKDHVRMEAIGAVDECNAAIGSVLAAGFRKR